MLAEVNGCSPSCVCVCKWVCLGVVDVCVGMGMHSSVYASVRLTLSVPRHSEQDAGVGIGAFWSWVKVQRQACQHKQPEGARG
jgi:hypothetical protein